MAVGVLGGEAFHEADHVVAEVADEAAEHGGEVVGDVHAGFVDDGAEALERRGGGQA